MYQWCTFIYSCYFVPLDLYSSDVLPVFGSIDSRSGPLESSVKWSGLGDRAHFDVTSPTQSLVINPVEAQDDGDYRCRVDFRSSPTRNLRVKLQVVGE